MHIFYDCFSLKKLDVSKFNTDKVTDMRYMFYRCASLNELNISNFNFSNAKYRDGMLSGCTCTIIRPQNELEHSFIL